jgi:4-diphosphocytidyl-2-C-methyl-D-erythritol kinase
MIYRSPAKINLTLDVLSRRRDGFHNLQSVVHCIGLYDELRFEFGVGHQFSLLCNDNQLTTDDNLCLKAARLWFEYIDSHYIPIVYMANWRPAHITLEKHIPMGAGLGGGSANAAATLMALNELYRSHLDEKVLHHLGAKIGADVPLFLKGGCVLMEGIGDRLSTLPTLEGAVVLIVPPQHASTPAVYRRFDELNAVTKKSTSALLEAIRRKNLSAAAHCLGNDLRFAAKDLGIDVELPSYLLKKYGALGAQMSGSGAASFGLFETLSAAQSAARTIRVDADLRDNYRVLVAPLIATGIEKIKANR